MSVECFQTRNPGAGFISQHTNHCALVSAHMDGEIRVNGTATHHVQYGISKDHPNGAGCLNACEKCAKKYEKRGDCIITKGAKVYEVSLG